MVKIITTPASRAKLQEDLSAKKIKHITLSPVTIAALKNHQEYENPTVGDIIRTSSEESPETISVAGIIRETKFGATDVFRSILKLTAIEAAGSKVSTIIVAYPTIAALQIDPEIMTCICTEILADTKLDVVLCIQPSGDDEYLIQDLFPSDPSRQTLRCDARAAVNSKNNEKLQKKMNAMFENTYGKKKDKDKGDKKKDKSKKKGKGKKKKK